MSNKIDLPGSQRRKFIKQTATGIGGAIFLPRFVLGGPGYTAPSDRLNIAVIGAGGRGRGVIRAASQLDQETGVTQENVVALCDVDLEQAAATFEEYPKAKRFVDFRIMLDEIANEIDAVIVATPDHTHAVAASAAMARNKHVYVEKPLTHDIYEARMLANMAAERGLVTQMGNQGNSSDDLRRICSWIWSGVIGDIREVTCWTNRPVWPQGIPRPTEAPPVPDTLNWDLWLGPAPMQSYHPSFVPFGWRGWWDFGTGALGDMGCHIVDPAFKALKLGAPLSVEAFTPTPYISNWTPAVYPEGAPSSSILHFEFAEREGMPPVHLSWYDGGLRPPHPAGIDPDDPIGDSEGGVLFIGSKGLITCGTYARNPRLLPSSLMNDFTEPDWMLPGVEGNHQTSWVAACKGGPAPSSTFDYAAPLTEMLLIGNLALRSFNLLESVTNENGDESEQFTGRKKLLWDAENMRITNHEAANTFVKREYRSGWVLS